MTDREKITELENSLVEMRRKWKSERFGASIIRCEMKKAAGIIRCLLTHTLHAGSLSKTQEGRRGRYKYNAPNLSSGYVLYSHRKNAAMKWLEDFKATPGPTPRTQAVMEGVMLSDKMLENSSISFRTRDETADWYADMIYYHPGINFSKINQSIINRWSVSALKYIKKKAWKYVDSMKSKKK